MTPYYDEDGITIYHGDCREITAWLAADILVTDPPYGRGWKQSEYVMRDGRTHDDRHEGIANDGDTSVRDAVIERWGFCRPGMVFGHLLAPVPAAKQVLIWRKPPNAGLRGTVGGFRRDVEAVYLIGRWAPQPPDRSSVIHPNTPTTGNPSSVQGRTGHPHAKPEELMRTLVDRCPPGAIADPFMGSGSTLRAAKDLGRRAIGVEVDERYCEVAAKRLGQGVLDFEGVA